MTLPGNGSSRWHLIQSPMPPVQRCDALSASAYLWQTLLSRMMKIIDMNDNLHLLDSTHWLGKFLKLLPIYTHTHNAELYCHLSVINDNQRSLIKVPPPPRKIFISKFICRKSNLTIIVGTCVKKRDFTLPLVQLNGRISLPGCVTNVVGFGGSRAWMLLGPRRS